MRESAELDALQQTVLDALETSEDPAQIRAVVASMAPEWAATWRDDAVRVAAVIAQKWVVRPR